MFHSCPFVCVQHVELTVHIHITDSQNSPLFKHVTMSYFNNVEVSVLSMWKWEMYLGSHKDLLTISMYIFCPESTKLLTECSNMSLLSWVNTITDWVFKHVTSVLSQHNYWLIVQTCHFCPESTKLLTECSNMSLLSWVNKITDWVFKHVTSVLSQHNYWLNVQR